jgi:hypothetical protein
LQCERTRTLQQPDTPADFETMLRRWRIRA